MIFDILPGAGWPGIGGTQTRSPPRAGGNIRHVLRSRIGGEGGRRTQQRSEKHRGKWYNVGVLNMCMMDEIRAKRDEIYAIARKHKAEKLWVFGSCARKEEQPDSDVDFLVKFAPEVSFMDYDLIERGISELLGRGVDVVSSSVLPNAPRFADRVCREAVAI